jgi:hypothetical protein
MHPWRVYVSAGPARVLPQRDPRLIPSDCVIPPVHGVISNDQGRGVIAFIPSGRLFPAGGVSSFYSQHHV